MEPTDGIEPSWRSYKGRWSPWPNGHWALSPRPRNAVA